MVICVARETSEQPQPVVFDVIREKHPTPDQVMIVNGRTGAPSRLIHACSSRSQSSYNDAVKNLEPMNPEEYVLIVPDWDGALLAVGLR